MNGKFIRTYSSQHEAAREMGCTLGLISQCVLGKTTTAYGYFWKRADEPFDIEKETRKRAPGKVVIGVNDLETLFPEIAAEWNHELNGDLKPSDVLCGSRKENIWWTCPKGHNYTAKLQYRTLGGTGCPYCDGKKVLPGFNDLASNNPDLAEEWYYSLNGDLLPSAVTAHSTKRVWWRCRKCGHYWRAKVTDRAKGSGCPRCASLKPRNLTPIPVCQYDADGKLIATYPSLCNAEACTGIARRSIKNCIEGKAKHAGGYFWTEE